MNSQEIIARLKQHESTLRAQDVAHAALFGSRARGDNRPDSDTDIMIELDPTVPIGVLDYVGIKNISKACLRGGSVLSIAKD